MLFPIDHGNSAMKTVNFVFPSGLIDNPIRPPVDTEMLEYDGKFWTLSGQRISYMRDKTKDERYWILTLFAIAKELEKSGNTSPMVEADLAVGLPPEHYALRQRFADYFKRGRVRLMTITSRTSSRAVLPSCRRKCGTLFLQRYAVMPAIFLTNCGSCRSICVRTLPSLLGAVRFCSGPLWKSRPWWRMRTL